MTIFIHQEPAPYLQQKFHLSYLKYESEWLIF